MFDLTKQKFNSLTVIHRAKGLGKNNYSAWECQCDCGKIKIIRAAHLKAGRIKSCGCKNRTSSKKFGEITGSHWSIIRHNAKKRNLEFTITIEYIWDLFLKQNRKCVLSGLNITFNKSQKKNAASLDRIDNSMGYIEGNVQWLHKDINKIKNIFNQTDFINYCRLVTDNNSRKVRRII